MLELDNNDYLFKGIFLFIFVISGNYLGQLLGCRLIYLLNENIITKHILGFITLFLTLAFTIDINTSLVKLFNISCILYILFILSSKTTKYINYLLIFIFLISFIIQLYKDRLKKKKIINKINKNEKQHLEYIEKYNNYIVKIIIGLLIIGLLIYIGEQKRSYKENFNYYTFFVGEVNCNEGTENINNLNEYWNSLKYTFNI
tara:strand:- start:2579 stop:3184 length:606 start_codon:yes stop_codon:yes gene_type:complete